MKYCFQCAHSHECKIYDSLIESLDLFKPVNPDKRQEIKNKVLEYLSTNCDEWKPK